LNLEPQALFNLIIGYCYGKCNNIAFTHIRRFQERDSEPGSGDERSARYLAVPEAISGLLSYPGAHCCYRIWVTGRS